jgi:hypothetical protein
VKGVKKLIFLFFFILFQAGIAQKFEWALRSDSTPVRARSNEGNFFAANGNKIFKFNNKGKYLSELALSKSLYLQCLKITPNNKLVVAGGFIDTITIGNSTFSPKGPSDALIAVFDTDLKLLWMRIIGGKNWDFCTSIAVDKDNGLYFSGSISDSIWIGYNFYRTLPGGSAFLLKTNDQGTIEKVTILDATKKNSQGYFFGNVYVNEHKQIAICGEVDYLDTLLLNDYALPLPVASKYGENYGNYFAYLLDTDGKVFSANAFEKERYTGCYYAGLTNSNFFNVKLSSGWGGYGTVLHVSDLRFNGTCDVKGFFCCDNYMFLLGNYEDRAYFLSSERYWDVKNGDQYDHMIFTISNNNRVALTAFSGQAYDCTLMKGENEDFYLSGIFYKKLKLDNITLLGDSVLNGDKYDYLATPFLAGLTIPANILGNSETPVKSVNFSVFPSPASHELKIRFEDQLTGDIAVVLYDQWGRIAFRSVISDSEGCCDYVIGTRDLPRGIYYLKCYSGNAIYETRKVLLE